MSAKANILVVCTQNSARSQMAEAYLRKYAGDRFNVMSAGVHPSRVHPLTIRTLEEAGFDASRHEAKSIKQFLGKLHVHYLIVVCGKAEKECPSAFPGLLERLFWPFDDPAAVEGDENERIEAFRKVRDEIEARVKDWVSELPARA
jgi:arsenate reductase